METLLISISLFATSILLGSMAFFYAVMAPLIFTKLEAAIAGPFIRQVFPWYYIVVISLSAIAGLFLALYRPGDALLLGAVCAAGVMSRQRLMPKINRARDAVLSGDRSAETRFSRLHKLSVWINAAQIIAVAILLARFV